MSILHDATPEEEQIAQDLLKLGISRASRISGKVVRELREKFYRNAGLFITDQGTIRELHSKQTRPTLMPYGPPADDHGRLIWFDDKPIVYLSQPYSLTDTDIKRIIAFSEKWRLEVSINPSKAMWYPGRTCAISYSVPGATYDTPWEDAHIF